MADKSINIRIGSGFVATGFARAREALKTLGKNLVNVQAGVALARAAFQKFSAVLTLPFKFETQTRQFKTLIGSIDEAKAHMADLKALGDTPPFGLDQFAAASRSLMVMTDGALGYKKSLELIGDAAAATGHPIEEMGQAVGRLYAFIRDGQPLSRAVMQLRNMGVISPEVAQKLQDLQAAGKSNAEIWAEVEAQLKRYQGAMKESEQTGEGLMAAIKSRWDNIVRALGDAFSDTAKDGMGAVLDQMKTLEEDGSLAVWADKCKTAAKAVSEAFKNLAPVVSNVWKGLVGTFDAVGSEIGRFAGAISVGNFRDAFGGIGTETARAFTEAFDLDGQQAKKDAEIKDESAKKSAARRAQADADAARREEEEEERKQKALAEGQKKIDQRNAEERAKAEAKAAEKAAKERERLDREAHQKRMADLRAEIAASKEAASPFEAVAEAAKTEFERAFEMYRDPERAKAEIDEERDRADDLKRLHKDASRYGGKWRIDELAELMSAGDTEGVNSRLEEWRKRKSFTPEVEAMVRASAAEQTRTTAEDELRKIEGNTRDLSEKLDQLLTMKGN